MEYRRLTRSRKKHVPDSSSEKSEDVTDKYINDILKNKHVLEDMCDVSSCSSPSTRSKTKQNEQYKKITKQIEDYTWIQCDNVDCQKWRQIPNTSAQEIGDDDKWYCYMNRDSQYNTCYKPEEDYTAYDKLAKKLGYKYVMSQLTEGALVWAKMHGYCRWPGMVTRDPTTGFFCDIDVDQNPTYYHVEYLGKNHSHAWISATNVTLYGHRDDTPKTKDKMKAETKSKKKGRKKVNIKQQSTTGMKSSYKRSVVDDAVTEAENLMNLNTEDRLNFIIFKPKLDKIQVKCEPVDDINMLDSTLNNTVHTHELELTTKIPAVSKKKNKNDLPNKPGKKKKLQDNLESVSVKNKVAKKTSCNFGVNRGQGSGMNQNVAINDASHDTVFKDEPGNIYSEGTLVLAKLDGYERWPALVTQDPSVGLFCEGDQSQMQSVHVEFLGPVHSHAWVKADRVCLYSTDNISQKSGKSLRQESTIGKSPKQQTKSQKAKYEKSREEAERMVSMSKDDRLQLCQFKYAVDDLQCKDSGFESYNYPPSSASSCASSAEKFAYSRLNHNTTLGNKSKEERFRLDVEMYKKNEKAFLHDLARFMKRNDVNVNLMANWHHVQVGVFQLFLAVHERGGYQEVCKKKQWSAVFRDVTETNFAPGAGPKNFYTRNIYPYELYVTGGDFESEIQKLKKKRKPKAAAGDLMIQEESGSFTNVQEQDEAEDSDDLTAILEDLEEYSTLCQLEEDIEADKKRMGINISYHDDSPFTKVSPGVKCFSTPSEFHGHKPYGSARKPQEVPETMFSGSNGESEDELIYHEMERIVNDGLL